MAIATSYHGCVLFGFGVTNAIYATLETPRGIGEVDVIPLNENARSDRIGFGARAGGVAERVAKPIHQKRVYIRLGEAKQSHEMLSAHAHHGDFQSVNSRGVRVLSFFAT